MTDHPMADRSPDDARLESLLAIPASAPQAEEFDLPAGLARFTAWLSEQNASTSDQRQSDPAPPTGQPREAPWWELLARREEADDAGTREAEPSTAKVELKQSDAERDGARQSSAPALPSDLPPAGEPSTSGLPARRSATLPEATVARLPIYLRALHTLVEQGAKTASAEELAALAGVDSAKLRKDVSDLGSYGTGAGYDLEHLFHHISLELGLSRGRPVAGHSPQPATTDGPSVHHVGRVFINYRVGDGAMVAGHLRESLIDALGTDAVLFYSAPRAREAFFDREILDAVDACDVMVAVIGPHWLASTRADGTRALAHEDDWVRRELALALQHRIPVVPLLVERATMPDSASLPSDIRDLARFHHLRLDPGSGGLGTVVERLLSLLPRRQSNQPQRIDQQLPVSRATVEGVRFQPDLASGATKWWP